MWERMQDALAQSLGNVLMELAFLLPKLVGFAVALFLGTVVAWIVSALVRRSLNSVEFDSRVRQWGFPELEEWSPERSPTRLIAGLAGWTCFLFGLLIGSSALYPDLTSVLVAQFLGYLPRVVTATLVLFIGFLAARYIARGVLISAVNMQIGSAHLLSVGVKWLILVVASAMALEQLEIGGRIVPLAFTILFGGIVLALALAIGLGSKDAVSRSWQRRRTKREEDVEEPFMHL
jgi:hypothetical protein